MRPSKPEYYLRIADAVSGRSTCRRRQYGAVLVKDDHIIATGYNGSAAGEPNCCDCGTCVRENLPHNSGYTSACPAVHAEANALLSAGREARGAILYLHGRENGKALQDVEPCEMCRRLIINAGVDQVVTRYTVIKFGED